MQKASGQSSAAITALTQGWTAACVCSSLSRVANAPKSAGPANPAKASVPFEEALQKLESIVEAMESGDLPLEGLLVKYEEGMKLARICQEKLGDAEVKIQQLEKTAAGDLKLKPLSAELSES